jgi:hypothetical protein
MGAKTMNADDTTGRRYSLDEIDRMRCAVSRMTSGADLAHKNAKVENTLRTYMAGGVSVEEIERKLSDRISWCDEINALISASGKE